MLCQYCEYMDETDMLSLLIQEETENLSSLITHERNQISSRPSSHKENTRAQWFHLWVHGTHNLNLLQTLSQK